MTTMIKVKDGVYASMKSTENILLKHKDLPREKTEINFCFDILNNNV